MRSALTYRIIPVYKSKGLSYAYPSVLVVGLSRRRPLPPSGKFAALLLVTGGAFAVVQPASAQTLQAAPIALHLGYSAPTPASSPDNSANTEIQTDPISLKEKDNLQVRPRPSYMPPDVGTGNSQPEPNTLVPFTVTPGDTLPSGTEIDGDVGYQVFVNGAWGAVNRFPQPFQFTSGGNTAATYTIPSLDWSQLKIIVNSSLLQNGVVTQNSQQTYNYTP